MPVETLTPADVARRPHAAGPDGEPMSPVDHAWLRMDEPGNRMTITGLLFFGTPLGVEDLRQIVAERLLPVKRFAQRVVRRGARARWVDAEVDLAAHVRPLVLPAPGDRASLERVAGDLMSEPLDLSRPLWSFHVIESYEGGSVVVTRLHHCIGDGIALMMVLLSLTEVEPGGDPDANPLAAIFRGDGAVGEEALEHARELLPEGMRLMVRPSSGELPRSRSRLAGRVARDLARLTFRSRDARTPFKGKLGFAKVVAWTDAIDLEEVKALRLALDATVNDVLLTAVTGALRRYLEHRRHPAGGVDVRAVVPVSLRRLDRLAALGNRFGLVFVSLPVGVAGVRERLAELRRRMNALKGSLEAGVVLGLLHAFGATPESVQRLAVRVFGAKATAVMTNVPGPRRTLYIAGRPISDLLFWVPQSGRLGMGISIISYAGKVRVGVATDAGLVPDPHVLVAAVHAELGTMREAAGLA